MNRFVVIDTRVVKPDVTLVMRCATNPFAVLDTLGRRVIMRVPTKEQARKAASYRNQKYAA